MATMMAARFEKNGSYPSWVEMEAPKPQRGEVRVKLRAAALNRRDYWITQGQYPGVEPPHVLGSDGVGTVDAVGPETDCPFSSDQRVVINPGLSWGGDNAFQSNHFEILGVPRDGTLAQYVTIPADSIFACPAHLSDAEAAALPLAGLTAYRALFTRAQLKPQDKVFISGLGGGVSSIGALFAKAVGTEVFGTSGSDEKLKTLQEHYQLKGFNYRSDGWIKDALQETGGVDVVLDGSGGEGFKDLLKLLKPGGRLAFYGGTCGKWPAILPQHLFYRQISILASTMGSSDDFRGMLDLVTKHQIKPIVWKEIEAPSVSEAFEAMATHSQLGKIVVAMPD